MAGDCASLTHVRLILLFVLKMFEMILETEIGKRMGNNMTKISNAFSSHGVSSNRWMSLRNCLDLTMNSPMACLTVIDAAFQAGFEPVSHDFKPQLTTL